MPNIANKLTQVQQSIQRYAHKYDRNSNSITLLAVSKTKPATDVEQAFMAGQVDFGENYLQEALDKMQILGHLPIIWHYIGAIQGNKARLIAEHFSWVHTIDRLKVAEKLSLYRPISMPPLQVCLQVNIDHQETKSGCSVNETLELASKVSKLPHLSLRGLMAIPSPSAGMEAFNELAGLSKAINSELGLSMDTLSMGMSADMELAISAGSTIVRIGTAIFGQRQ